MNAEITLLELEGSKVYLVGTAHVSEASAALAAECIREHRPETVCVELCDARAEALRNPDRWRNTNVFSILKAGKAYVLLAQLLLSSFQRKIARQLGIRPGQEMISAMDAAEEVGAGIINVDRDVKITLRRAWAKAGLLSMLRMTAAMITSLFSTEEISKEQVEELKTGDALAEIMSEFSQYLPGVKEVLIDERDQYMAVKIARSPGASRVAVVGAGHVPGIIRHLSCPIDPAAIAALEELPKPGWKGKVIAWTIFFGLLALFIFGFTRAGTETGIQMIGVWVAATGGFAALGALAALAHPLTILCAFLSAPVTCLHPAVAVGWVCALVEAYLRKPRVCDLENLAQDAASVRGFWSNRVSKVLLVLMLANIGGAIGMLVGSGMALTILR